MGWLQLVGSIKLQVSFAKETYKRDNILRKWPIILSILLTVATPYQILQHTTTHYNTISTHLLGAYLVCRCCNGQCRAVWRRQLRGRLLLRRLRTGWIRVLICVSRALPCRLQTSKWNASFMCNIHENGTPHADAACIKMAYLVNFISCQPVAVHCSMLQWDILTWHASFMCNIHENGTPHSDLAYMKVTCLIHVQHIRKRKWHTSFMSCASNMKVACLV